MTVLGTVLGHPVHVMGKGRDAVAAELLCLLDKRSSGAVRGAGFKRTSTTGQRSEDAADIELYGTVPAGLH